MERKIIDYLPDVARGYAEFIGIAAGQQKEFEKAWEKADSLLGDQFILSEDLPYTLPKLREMLNNLCGGKYTAELTDYTLSVKLGLAAKSNYSDVVTLLERVLPANMTAEVSLLYNRHSMLAAYTHEQLHAHTHEELRTEETFQNGE